MITTRQRQIRPVTIYALCLLVALSLLSGIGHSKAKAPGKLSLRADDGHELTVWAKPAAEAEADVILLLHGRTWSTRPNFDLHVPGESKSLMEGLREQGFNVYGLDQRGYGATPRDNTGWLTPRRAAADTAAALAWLRQRHPDSTVILFGYSYGATTAQLALQLNPDVADALILYGYPLRPEFDRKPRASGSPLKTPTSEAAAASDFILEKSISKRTIINFVKTAVATDPVRMDWRRLDQWRMLDVKQLDHPLLLLDGAHDPISSQTELISLYSNYPNPRKRWITMPNSSHVAFLENSRDEFINAIRDFATHL